MNKGVARMRNRISAWILTLVMIVGLAAVPAGEAQAADKITVTDATNTSLPVYVELKKNQESSTTDYGQYDVIVHNNSGETISDWTITIQFKVNPGYNAGWNGVSCSAEDMKITITTYGGSGWDNATIYDQKTGSGAGFQVNEDALRGATVTLTYAKGKSTSGPEETGGGGTGGGTGGAQGDTTTDLNLDVEYNFAKLLQYSLYFYDANMCGELEGKCGVNWRKNCHLADKTVTYKGKTINVSGGFHDAGDHDKFGLPQGYSASILGIGYYEYKEAYEKTGQKSHFKTILDYFCDYFVRCTVLDDSGNAIAFCYQVGDGKDHESWVAAEDENINRPAYFADSSNPATDQVSEAAAALAIHYMNFGNKTYLEYAEKLFAMAKQNSKSAKNSDTATGEVFYKSSTWKDDYCLAAAWLYKATKDASYLAEYNANMGDVSVYSWPSWDEVGPYALAYGSGDFSPLETNVKNTLGGTQTISNGYAWLCQWGSARYNCNMQLEGLIYDKNSGKAQYTEWANGQMRFLLGNSDNKRCYVVGYNENSSKYPHHRSSSGYGGFPNAGYATTPQAHVLTGALVGGIESADGTYHDSSADYYCNEVAIDYNAAFTGAAAALYLLNEKDEDQMLDSNYNIDAGAECPSNEGGIAKNGGEEIEKTKLADSQISFPTAEAVEYGTTLAEVKLSRTSDDYGTYAWKEPTLQPEVGTDSYEMVYTPKNTRNYDYSGLTGYDAATGTVIREVQVTVTKKILKDITFPVVSKTVAAGTALKDITLSKTEDAYGTFSWKTPNTIVTKDMTDADMVYTLKDAKNVGIDQTVSGVNEAGTSVTRKVSFTVSRNRPQVSVPGTFSVTAGTKLQDIPLTGCKAPEGVEGTFSWKEAADTLITYAHNNQKFTVVFTPKDTDTYETVETVVTFKVTKQDYDQVPDSPTVAKKTDKSVTLSPYADNDKKVLYGMKEGNSAYTWQESNEFTNLSPYTTYTFALKFAGDDIYNDSAEGKTLSVTTYLSEKDCYTVDLSKLSDADYVEAHNGKIEYDETNHTLTLKEAGPYTITGSNPDVTVDCGQAKEVVLDNAKFKRLEATEDIVITLKGNNTITDGIVGEKKVTVKSGTDSPAGSLTVTGGESGSGAITGQEIVIESGDVTATGKGDAPALKAEGDIQLKGGSLNANTETGTEPPIQTESGDIILEGTQIQSKAEEVYSKPPVDAEGNPVEEVTITYDYGDGKTEQRKAGKGTNVTLPEFVEEKEGYKAEGWYKQSAPDEILKPGTKVTVEEDLTFYAKYVKVEKKVESISLLLNPTTLEVGSTVRPTLTVVPADADDISVNWQSSNPAVATVAGGLITAVAPGTAVITATANDGSGKSGAITITVIGGANDADDDADDEEDDDPEIKAQSMALTAEVRGAGEIPVKGTMKLAPKKKMTIDVSFLPEDAEDEDVTFTSSNPKIAKIDSNGKITAGKKPGKTKITVKSESGISKSFTVQVMKKAVTKVTIKASKSTLKVKKTLKLKAVLTPDKKQASNAVFWKSSNKKIATVDASGKVKGIKKGKVKITAVATDGSGKKKTYNLKVN